MGGPRLHKGGMVPPEEVVMTVVKTRPIFVRASIDEKDLQYLRTGMKGKVVPTTASDQKLPAVLESISNIPVSAGSFDAKIALEAGKDIDALVPGMACAIKVVAYQQKDALIVPSKSVHADELDEDQHFVYLVKKDAKPEKRTVTVGKTSGDKTEILSGLQEGDEILQDKPDGSKKTSTPSLGGKLLDKYYPPSDK
jgi:multidrug efflux pump subunit AcrA (membrane-fusion protein)